MLLTKTIILLLLKTVAMFQLLLLLLNLLFKNIIQELYLNRMWRLDIRKSE